MAVSKIPKDPISTGEIENITNDLDLLNLAGMFYHSFSGGGAIANCPTSVNFSLLSMNKTGKYAQVIIDNNGDMFYRTGTSAGFYAWKKVSSTAVT